MHHSSTAWRVCCRKVRQDHKGLIIVVLAPAEGKTRLERFNYSCTAATGPIPHKKYPHKKTKQQQKNKTKQNKTKQPTRFGISSDVRELAEGKIRLEKCNYSSTTPAGPTPHRKQHTYWSILQCTCTGEGKTRLKGSNPSYPACTHCGVEYDVPF